MKRTKEDEYRLAFEIRDKKAHIIVYEPVISKEETEKRLDELKGAVHDFWESYYREQARAARKKMKGEKSNV